MEDKIRIREAIEIRNTVGESVWSGITKVPFAIVLIGNDYEFLFNHPYPSSDFSFLEDDPVTGSKIYYRERTFPIYLQASFPAVNGLSCVVIGLPVNTQSKNSTRWVLTLLHEHFHQYQEYQPYAFANIDALDLSGGDQTGMWQINYPFPYEDQGLQKYYSAYTNDLLAAISSREQKDAKDHYEKFLKSKQAFLNRVSSKDAAYFSFQLWKEGIARYTEYKILNELEDYMVSEEFIALKDYMPFREYRTELFDTELKNIRLNELPEAKRGVVYSLGFGEGVLMDAIIPDWHRNYFNSSFTLTNIQKNIDGTINK